ncbi:MAG: RNA-directed polymerase [Chloroflexota bacterium]|nr:RNA-directed polymerase [Chloroflexota bacterium]
MSQEQSQAQSVAQASQAGQAAGVGPEVGGVHSNSVGSRLDLHARSGEYRAALKAQARDSACSHACQRSKGRGDGPARAGIKTPDKVRQLQRTLYRKAKAEPKYRFWSLYGDLMRRDVLEQALQRVAANHGGPGVDGQRVETILASPESQRQWLDALQAELKAKTYRPSPVRRVFIAKGHGGLRPLGIPTVKDRVVQMAAMLVLMPIFEADFHPRSFGFRPRRNAHQALEESVRALRRGRSEVLDADLSKYFDTIPHRALLRLVARRISDGSVLRLLQQWLRAPVVEEDRDGGRRVHPNLSGTPQGGVISPLLANLYLNGLDWAVNEKVVGQPVLVRYADDLVILSAPGQGAGLRERLRKWLHARGLSLNEEKTRLVNSREGFNFLGFTVRWQRARAQGRWYGHVEPSAKSRQELRAKVRSHLNHWTHWKSIREVVAELNPLLRGWSGYFHFRHSSRVMGQMQGWVRACFKGWLWRKQGQSQGKWAGYPDDRLHERYGLWRLPTKAAWKLA